MKRKLEENAEILTEQQKEINSIEPEKQKLIDEMNNLKGVKTEKKV